MKDGTKAKEAKARLLKCIVWKFRDDKDGRWMIVRHECSEEAGSR